jgi:hypothetical protein
VQATPHQHRALHTRRSRRSSAGPESSSHRAAISVPAAGRDTRGQLKPSNARPRQSSERPASNTRAPRGLLARITWRATGDLKPFPNNPRRHPESQIAGLMKSIDLVWTNPILIDESATILAGHCRLEAAKRLGMADVPTITIAGLSDSERRAIVIADNRLPERAVWDFDLLRENFRNLIELDFEVELSGFTTGEIDLVMDGKPAPSTANDPADDLTEFTLDGPAAAFEPSLCLSRSPFPGNGISGPEKNAQKRLPDCNDAVSENEPSHRSPPIGGPFARLQEISGSIRLRGGGCSPDRTSLPTPNSLLTGKLTGNFADSGSLQRFWRPVSERIQWLPAKFPTQRNREFLEA